MQYNFGNESNKYTAIACRQSTIWAWFFGIVSVLAIATCGFFFYGMNMVNKVKVTNDDYYKTQTLNVYRESLFRLSDGLENADANIGKLLVASDVTFISKTLTDTDGIASAAVTDVSVLPVSQEVANGAAKYFNQLGDYCTSLARYVVDNGKLTDEQKDSLKNLRMVGKKLKTAIDGVVVSQDETKLQTVDKDGYFSIELEDIDETTFDYPQLVYDGPFSDSVTKKTIKRKVLSHADATEKLKTTLSELGEVSSVEYKSEAKNKGCVYYFDVTVDGKNYTVTTATDGTVVELVKNGENFDDVRVSSVKLTDESDKTELNGQELENECCQTAVRVAEILGYDVTPMWVSEPIEGRVYVNLICRQNGLNVYTDMVKMVFDADDCAVVGVDAFAYLSNHRQRDVYVPSLSADEARGRIAKDLETERTELCIVPDGENERVCYEIRVKNGDEKFLIYISADTGEEVEILKIIEDKLGYTVM